MRTASQPVVADVDSFRRVEDELGSEGRARDFCVCNGGFVDRLSVFKYWKQVRGGDVAEFPDSFAIDPYFNEGAFVAVLEGAGLFVKTDKQEAGARGWHVIDQDIEVIFFLEHLHSRPPRNKACHPSRGRIERCYQLRFR